MYCRDEVEQEDYQEKVVFQLAEQEEEDELDRIKEESRRRRQAILEKYKVKNSQKEQVTQSGDVGNFFDLRFIDILFDSVLLYLLFKAWPVLYLYVNDKSLVGLFPFFVFLLLNLTVVKHLQVYRLHIHEYKL